MYGVLLIARAALLDRSQQEEIDNYNELLNKFIGMYLPKDSKTSESVKMDMQQEFNLLFKGPDGKPKTLSVRTMGD